MPAGIESTKEEDFEVYSELKSYSPDAIEMTTFEYGQYAEEFDTATSWRFDPTTGDIIFSFEEIGGGNIEIKPIPYELKELKDRTEANELAILALMDSLYQ